MGATVEPLGAEGTGGRSDVVRRREIIATVSAAAFVWLAFSHFVLLVPIRLLVTLVHEASHAMSAMAFGADVLTVTVNPSGGGLTRWRGSDGWFSRLVIASAGYVGTAVVGAVMLELCRRLRSGRVALYGLAGLVVAIGLAWVPWRFDDPDPLFRAATGSSSGDGRFTVLVCVVAVLVLVALGTQRSTRVRRSAVIVLATCLCLAAVEDLRHVLDISRAGGHSDAATAASVTPLPSWMWAAIWLAFGLIVCAGAAWSVVASDRGRPSPDSPALDRRSLDERKRPGSRS